MLLQPSSFLHPLSPTEEHVAVNECNHGRDLLRLIHHLRGRPCPYHDRETPAGETWTPPLTIAESGVLRDAFNGVVDKISTPHVSLIKELASLEVAPASSVDSCASKVNQERSRPRSIFWDRAWAPSPQTMISRSPRRGNMRRKGAAVVLWSFGTFMHA